MLEEGASDIVGLWVFAAGNELRCGKFDEFDEFDGTCEKDWDADGRAASRLRKVSAQPEAQPEARREEKGSSHHAHKHRKPSFRLNR
jgi:hypothetical protein